MPETSIYKLFAEFRHKVKQPTQTKKGYNYKYADLAALQNVIQEALPDGLAYYQDVASNGEEVIIQTIFFDSAGNKIESSQLHLPQTKGGKMNNIQAIGSTITYGRRYQLSAMAGISSEEDDDGNATATDFNSINSSKKAVQKVAKKPAKPAHIPPTSQQMETAQDLIKQLAAIKQTTQQAILEDNKIKSMGSLNQEQADRFITKLQKDIDTAVDKGMEQIEVTDDDLPF